MNARQKAKKYKKALDSLNSKVIKPNIIVNNVNIDTLRFKREFPEYWAKELLRCECESFVKKTLSKDIAFLIAGSLEKYIEYKSEFDARSNNYVFTGELKVVNRQ